MKFSTLNPSLATIASQAVAHSKQHYGSKGLRIEEQLASDVRWRPTFFLKPKAFETLAIEVSDILYPEAVKAAIQEIRHLNSLVKVAQFTTLDSYLADKNHKIVNQLRDHGLGLFTVDSDNRVIKQFDCIPLLQFIPSSDVEAAIKKLPAGLKVRVRSAYSTYQTNPVQGVQDAGQVVEGLVRSMARQTSPTSNLSSGSLGGPLASLIDAMYTNNYYQGQRAALGSARASTTFFRNPSSHPPKSARDAAQRVKDAAEGFRTALRDIGHLADGFKALNCKIKVFD